MSDKKARKISVGDIVRLRGSKLSIAEYRALTAPASEGAPVRRSKRSASRRALAEDPLEKEVSATIAEILELRGKFGLRLNSGSVPTPTGFVRLGEAGTPDRIFFEAGLGVFAEIKRRSADLSPSQTNKQAEIRRRGILVSTLRSGDDVERLLGILGRHEAKLAEIAETVRGIQSEIDDAGLGGKRKKNK